MRNFEYFVPKYNLKSNFTSNIIEKDSTSVLSFLILYQVPTGAPCVIGLES